MPVYTGDGQFDGLVDVHSDSGLGDLRRVLDLAWAGRVGFIN